VAEVKAAAEEAAAAAVKTTAEAVVAEITAKAIEGLTASVSFSPP
jgi:hypothetical protein